MLMLMQIIEALRKDSLIVTSVLGIATIMLGLLALLVPLLFDLSINSVVAVLLIATGIAQSIFAFQVEPFYKGFAIFLFAGLSIVTGGAMLIWLVLGLNSLTILLLVYFLLGGVFEIIIAFRVKPQEGWDWLLVSGVPAVVLAGLIGWEWTLSGAWAIDALLGIRLWFTGWWMIVIGACAEDSVAEVKHSSSQESENRIIVGFEANDPTVSCTTGQRLPPG